MIKKCCSHYHQMVRAVVAIAALTVAILMVSVLVYACTYRSVKSVAGCEKSTVYFVPNTGGLGDVLVGCSSAYILSIALGANFKIAKNQRRGSVQLDALFDTVQVEPPLKHIELTYFGHQDIKDEMLNGTLNRWRNVDVCVHSNLNFSQYLYSNQNLHLRIAIKPVDVIGTIFTKCLHLKQDVIEAIDFWCRKYDIANSITVHIRCNNRWQDSNTGESTYKIDGTVENFLACISAIRRPDQNVILFTDNLPDVAAIFNRHKVAFLAIPGDVHHTDRSAEQDFQKTIIDLMLINRGEKSVVSYWSNFSRMSVLLNKRHFYVVQPKLVVDSSLFDFNIHSPVITFREGSVDEMLAKND